VIAKVKAAAAAAAGARWKNAPPRSGKGGIKQSDKDNNSKATKKEQQQQQRQRADDEDDDENMDVGSWLFDDTLEESEEEEELGETEVIEWEPEAEPDASLLFSKASSAKGGGGKQTAPHAKAAAKSEAKAAVVKAEADVKAKKASKLGSKAGPKKASKKNSKGDPAKAKTTWSVAHGGLKNHGTGDKAPMNAEAAMDALLNLPLLGAFHSHVPLPGGERVAMLGAAEPSESAQDAIAAAAEESPSSAAADADADADADAAADAAKQKRKYLIGLTTSAGFGDQFKRVSVGAVQAEFSFTHSLKPPGFNPWKPIK
jgi:hypothetical protein